MSPEAVAAAFRSRAPRRPHLGPPMPSAVGILLGRCDRPDVKHIALPAEQFLCPPEEPARWSRKRREDVRLFHAGHTLAIVPEALATASLLREAADRQLTAHPSSHRELGFDVAESQPMTWADRARLLQVFDNLLGNAMKYSNRHITLGAGRKNGDGLFWVTDDGNGIEAEDLPHVFDRFWQASKADRAGAGLGLPIAKGIIQAHGGKIWVESQVNAGTTFFFTLPGISAEHAAAFS